MATPLERLTAALAERYRIERELGAGGMATVYLAQDLRHDRRVALKVLRPELAAVLGAERFVQEIKTTAALQHPHILPLFDSGRTGGPADRRTDEFLYYVMPYVEGETLRDKLNRETQLGVDQAVRIATEVADALDYAHRHGVIHRDIKPENVLLHDGRPMVADFGIALAVSAAAGGRMTETGLSLGTPHYMSPEQATAEKEITARSDVYSLGSVLYEMLTGNPPHTGASAQQIIMKIIAEPVEAVTKFRKSVPANVAAAVAKSLEKLPADRFETARAFAEALADPGFTVAGTAGQTGLAVADDRWRRRFVAMAVLATAFAAVAATSLLRRAAPSTPSLGPVRFRLSGSDSLRINTQWTTPFAVSPDGRTIVFGAEAAGSRHHLWARSLDAPMARRLENTEDGAQPAFSPDGEWVAFMASDRLIRKVRLAGGPATDVGTLNAVSAALAWMSEDTLVAEYFGDKGIHRVSAGGGTPVELIPLDTAANEIRQRRPFVLRRDRMLVYASRTADDRETLVMVSLTNGRRVRLVEGVQALGMVDGHLVYTRGDGNLMAVALDVGTMRVTGTPMELGDRVVNFSFGAKVALSEGGTLVSVPRAAKTGRLLLMDTLARSRPIGDLARGYSWPRFSPDGRHLAVAASTGDVGSAEMTKSDLWLIERSSGDALQLTRTENASRPAWTPDGKRLIYIATTPNGGEVWSLALDGSAPAARLVDLGGSAVSAVVAPDGPTLFALRRRDRSYDLVRVPLDQSSGGAPAVTVVAARLDRPDLLRISPDGKWLGYQERWSGIHVRSVDGANTSEYTGDGWGPTWSGDPRHVYFSTENGWTIGELRTAPTLSLAGRRQIGPSPFLTDDFDVSPDGAAFVVAPEGESNEILVTVGWIDELRRVLRRRGPGD